MAAFTGAAVGTAAAVTGAAATAATATTIAAGVTVATGVIGGTSALVQAGKQRKAAGVAAASSEVLMRKAQKEIEKDEYEALNIPKEAFEAERIANAQNTAQNVEALREGGQRAIAGGVGKVGAISAQNTERGRIAMGDALYENDLIKADSRQARNDEMASFQVGQAQDQQAYARDMEEAATASTMSGFNALGGAISAGAAAVPLYTKSRQDRRIGQMMGSDAYQDFVSGGGTQTGATRIDATGNVIPIFEENPDFVKGAKEGDLGFGVDQFTKNQVMRDMTSAEQRQKIEEGYGNTFKTGKDFRKARKAGGFRAFGGTDFKKFYE